MVKKHFDRRITGSEMHANADRMARFYVGLRVIASSSIAQLDPSSTPRCTAWGVSALSTNRAQHVQIVRIKKKCLLNFAAACGSPCRD